MTDKQWLKEAELASSRATCPRLSVGAIIVDSDGYEIGCGWNAANFGTPQCNEVSCELVTIDGKPSCIRTIHAEVRAIYSAASSDEDLHCATIYVTHSPCYDCAKMIIQAEISRVVYAEHYDSRKTELALELLKDSGVEVEWVNEFSEGSEKL